MRVYYAAEHIIHVSVWYAYHYYYTYLIISQLKQVFFFIFKASDISLYLKMCSYFDNLYAHLQCERVYTGLKRVFQFFFFVIDFAVKKKKIMTE